MENNETNEVKQEPVVVKESNHVGLKILLVILIIAVIVLSGILVYDKFIAKDNTQTTNSNS